MNDEIEKIIAKFKGDLSGNFEEILQEIAKEAYIKGRKERTVTVSEIVSIKQLAEILGVNISRANAIVKKAHEEMGIGFQLGKSWFILESEIDLIRPGKTGKPPSAFNIKLKINEELKKNISNKVDSIVSETERTITINDLICETLEEALLKDKNFSFSPDFKYPLENDTSIALALTDKKGRQIFKIANFLSAKYDKKITKQDLILQVLYKNFWLEE